MVVSRTRRAVVAALSLPRRRLQRAPLLQGTPLLPSTASRASWGALERPHALQRLWLSTSTTTTSTTPTAADHKDHETVAAEVHETARTPMVPKNDKDALFLRALRHYYEREGNFFVAPDFVVPSGDADAWPEELWGVQLGVRVRNFSRGVSNDYKKSMLKSVGFPYDDWKTYVWEMQLLPSLHKFKEIFGHTFVRFPFVVPKDDARFPPCTWGYKLGFAVALLRQQREAMAQEQRARLNKMDFIWTENHFKLKVLFMPAFKRFHEVFGHRDVPKQFVVPMDRDETLWQKELHGTKLGTLYACLKNGSFEEDTVADCRDQLQELGTFDADQGAVRVWDEIVFPSLEIFPTACGSHEIPEDFVVPNERPWPQAAWGYPLGYVVQTMLHGGGVFADQVTASKPALRQLGFRWNVLFGRWARQLLPAVRCYREMYGHSDVPVTFIVPDSDPWPVEARTYHLGRQLQLVRKFGRDSVEVADALEELEALDFKFQIVESDFSEKILPALRVYAALHNDCEAVPRRFIVPHEAPWPQKAYGLRLGAAASAIRARKQYRRQVDQHRDELKTLGFSWTLPQSTTAVDREVVQPCLVIYKEVYGDHAVMDQDFTVPSDDNRWPVEASGFQLGKWLQTHSRRRRSGSSSSTSGLMENGDAIYSGSPNSSSRSSSGLAGGGATSASGRNSASRRRAVAAAAQLTPHQEQYWNDVLLASFTAYASVNGSCATLEDNFVVPSEPPYPKIAYGLNLGLRLRYIRHHDRYAAEVAKYRNELETLGVLPPTAA